MDKLLAALNSPFGLLVTGAIISGLGIQYITSRWQQRNWIFQQKFAADSARFAKELEQKCQLLDDINTAVSTILAHSQFIVAAYVKGLATKQINQVTSSYNDAVLKWGTDFGLYAIRLKTLFSDKEIFATWDAIKEERDKLDVAIYDFSDPKRKSPEEASPRMHAISHLTVEISRRMISEMNEVKHLDMEGKGDSL